MPTNCVLIDFENIQPKNLNILADHPFKVFVFIGELAAADPTGSFHLISKDKGFDPLIRHLKGKKIQDRRESDLAGIANLRIPKKAKKDDMIDAIVKNLVGRGQSRPRKVKTLQNTINSLVSESLDNAKLTALVGELQKRKFIIVDQGNIRYTLPAR